MHIKTGLRFKHTEGPAKGKTFTILEVTNKEVKYRSQETGIVYTKERKEFEKYLQQVKQYWSNTNKQYKKRKEELQ